MTNKEIYELKRENFKNESLTHFRFLVTDLGYDEPKLSDYTQPNGTTTSDIIEYKNLEQKKTVQIKNSYHPVDYGFEFNLWNSITDLNRGDGNMLEYVAKEEQDVEQTYIKKVADLIKDKHLPKMI